MLPATQDVTTLTVAAADLAKALSIVKRGCATHSRLIPLQLVHLTVANGVLGLLATDLQMAIRWQLPAVTREPAAICVSPTILSGVLDQMTGDVDITIKETTLTLANGQSTAVIYGINPAEFPTVSDVIGDRIEINALDLRMGLLRVLGFAKQNASRPILSAVCMEITDNHLAVIASDGYRIAIQNLQLAEPAKTVSAIIPTAPLHILTKLLGRFGSSIGIRFAGDGLSATFQLANGIELSTRLVSETYPNYKLLIPTEHTTRAIVDRLALLRALNQAAVFARQGSGAVLFAMKDDHQLTISATADTLGSISIQIPATIEGITGNTALNTRFLQDVLRVLPAGDIVMEKRVKESVEKSYPSPVVLYSANDNTFLRLLMPLRITVNKS